jgi:hypothetical protein
MSRLGNALTRHQTFCARLYPKDVIRLETVVKLNSIGGLGIAEHFRQLRDSYGIAASVQMSSILDRESGSLSDTIPADPL